MNQIKPLYHGYCFPSEIIGHAVWLYHRFCLSFRDAEDRLAERGIVVSFETIRSWCNKFGPVYARSIKKRWGPLGDIWFLDKVYIVTVRVEQHYLGRAVDRESLRHEPSECCGYGEVVDVLLQKRRDSRAAKKFCIKVIENASRRASKNSNW